MNWSTTIYYHLVKFEFFFLLYWRLKPFLIICRVRNWPNRLRLPGEKIAKQTSNFQTGWLFGTFIFTTNMQNLWVFFYSSFFASRQWKQNVHRWEREREKKPYFISQHKIYWTSFANGYYLWANANYIFIFFFSTANLYLFIYVFFSVFGYKEWVFVYLIHSSGQSRNISNSNSS